MDLLVQSTGNQLPSINLKAPFALTSDTVGSESRNKAG